MRGGIRSLWSTSYRYPFNNSCSTSSLASARVSPCSLRYLTASACERRSSSAVVSIYVSRWSSTDCSLVLRGLRELGIIRYIGRHQIDHWGSTEPTWCELSKCAIEYIQKVVEFGVWVTRTVAGSTCCSR